MMFQILLAAVLAAATAPADTFDDLRFRSIGPAVMGGRIDVVAVSPLDDSIIFVGAASGGLWRTTNMGTTWTPLFDDQATSSIGHVALAPSDPDVVWVGTGESNNRQSSTFGNGVYRSLDGGDTFEHLGLEATQHIGAIAVHPRNPDHAYVAALGGLWAPNEERGVFRTTDGGASWEKVLYVDADTGAVSLVMDPVNPNVLYAATYQRRRVPWGFDGGGPGSGIHKTVDGGEHWRRLENGVPEGPLGRIGLAIQPSDPRTLYALIEHAEASGLYRSQDRGESFERVNDLNPRPMYYSKVILDPSDEDRVYVLGAPFYYSDDAGRTFVENEDMTPTYDVGVHGDHHTLWVDPDDPDHLVLGGDGGLYFSWDRGIHWDKVNNIPLTQFYDIAVDMETPYNIYGGAQDTHSWGGPSTLRTHIGILNSDWFQTNFGDGMYQQADPTDPDIVYTESQGGNIVRLDRKTGDRKSVKPYPTEDQDDFRFHWTSPILVSSHDPSVVYFGGNRLFTSRDRGESWVASRDLTWNEDRDELPIMAGVPNDETLSRHDGVSDWGTLTSIAESPLEAGVLFVGSDDGRIHVTRDGGETWESVEANIKAGFDVMRSKVSRLVASQASASRAYLSLDRHHLGDFKPYVFVTEDYGASWRSLSDGLPERGWVNVVVEHPRNENLLFAGTETGLFMSFDRGSRWLAMRGNFPTVPVDDLVIHPRDNDLVVGTHGRAIYILDDITPLEQYRPSADELLLFDPRAAVLFLPWKHESYGGQRQFTGENAPAGAIVTFYVPDAAAAGDSSAVLSIRDSGGAVLRTMESKPTSGFNRVVWDLTADAPEGVSGAGPRVPPGAYTVELGLGGAARSSSIEVVLDPRLDIPQSELRSRFDFLNEVNALRARIDGAVQETADVITQLERLSEVFSGDEHAALRESMSSAVERLRTSRSPIGGGRPSFSNPSLSALARRLYSELEGSEVQQGTLHGPTAVHRERLRDLSTRATSALAEHESVLSEVVTTLNQTLSAMGAIQIER